MTTQSDNVISYHDHTLEVVMRLRKGKWLLKIDGQYHCNKRSGVTIYFTDPARARARGKKLIDQLLSK